MNEPLDESTFYILGAGFSYAISQHMPLLTDLTAGVLNQLGLPKAVLDPFGSNLEQWLSHISVDQPWLGDSDNLTNRATFLRASNAVRDCIDRAEAQATKEAPKPWLLRLVCEMCERCSKAATFNYDLLLERATSHARRVHTWADLYGISLEGRYPIDTAPFPGPQRPPGDVFTLFKLHGSTNWGYQGTENRTNEAVVLMRSLQSWLPTPTNTTITTAQRSTFLYDDLVPMIVPPTTTKNPYYGNTVLRAQWRRAHQALRTAREIVIVGFSFPPSDLQVRHFLTSAAHPSMRVTVVDRRAESVDVIRELLPQVGSITTFIGDSAVSDYVEANCGDLIRWGMTYEPDGWNATLTVNDLNVLDDAVLADKPWQIHDHASPGSWLKAEVTRRWPSIDVEEAVIDPDQPENGGGQLPRMAHFPRTHSSSAE